MDNSLLELPGEEQHLWLRETAPQTRSDRLKGYWVLFVYSLFSASQGWQWGLPGPISTTLQTVYPSTFNDSVIELLLNWGPITFIPMAFLFLPLLSRRQGLRLSTIVGVALVAAGAACRCAAQKDDVTSLALWHIAAILNGCAGPIAMAGPSNLAEQWFPPARRATATAIAAQANIIGGAAGFLVPYMIPSDTLAHLNSVYLLAMAVSGFNLLCCCYFPGEPSVPPSKSAAHEAATADKVSLRSLWAGVSSLVRNGQFMVLCAAYAVGGGFSSAWSGTLNMNLSRLGLDQDESGLIGFVSTLAGNVCGVLIGMLVDAMRKMKPSLVILAIVNACSLVWFAVILQPLIRFSSSATLAQIWVSSVISGIGLNASVALYFELGVESAFPISSSTILMFLTTIYNACTLVLLFIPVASAAAVLNWTFAGGCVATTLTLIIFYREQSRRYDYDTAGGGSSGRGLLAVHDDGDDARSQQLWLDAPEGSDDSKMFLQGMLNSGDGAAVALLG